MIRYILLFVKRNWFFSLHSDFSLFPFLFLSFFVFILFLTTNDHSPFEQDIMIIEL